MNAGALSKAMPVIHEIVSVDATWSVQFLQGFEQWLSAGGFSVQSIGQYYLRVARWLVTLMVPQAGELPDAMAARWEASLQACPTVSASSKKNRSSSPEQSAGISVFPVQNAAASRRLADFTPTPE